jgi:hypothetical protein
LATFLEASVVTPALANDGLDAGGLTFKDFGNADNGASFNRADPMLPGGPDPAPARVLSIDNQNGLARVFFDSVKVEISLPQGWQATEDGDRGVGFSADRKTRVLVWRVDFAFEGVRDAEHCAQAGRRHFPDRLRQRAAQPGRQRPAHGVRRRGSEAGKPKGGCPDDPRRRGGGERARPQAASTSKVKTRDYLVID